MAPWSPGAPAASTVSVVVVVEAVVGGEANVTISGRVTVMLVAVLPDA